MPSDVGLELKIRQRASPGDFQRSGSQEFCPRAAMADAETPLRGSAFHRGVIFGDGANTLIAVDVEDY